MTRLFAGFGGGFTFSSRKLRSNWYGVKDESSLSERLVKVAAIAVRALEEIKITR